MMFVFGFLTGTILTFALLSETSILTFWKKTARPEIGSRWEFRGSEGDVVFIAGSTLLFLNDTGGRQVAPVDYFMATAKHRWSPSEEKKP